MRRAHGDAATRPVSTNAAFPTRYAPRWRHDPVSYTHLDVYKRQVLLAIKQMGGESTEAWPTVLDDLVKRGLRRPELLIVDGGAGLESAIAAVWDSVPAVSYTHLDVYKRQILCGEIKLLIDGFCGEGFPAIDFAHVDLSGSKQRPEQHGGRVRRRQHSLRFCLLYTSRCV